MTLYFKKVLENEGKKYYLKKIFFMEVEQNTGIDILK